MAKRLSRRWILVGVLLVVAAAAAMMFVQPVGKATNGCAANQFYCPGVGCLSGADKCKAGNAGGPARVFSSVEHFVPLRPADLEESPSTQPFDSLSGGSFPKVLPPSGERKSCEGGTRSDGACLMEFSTP